jgi:hypothetical protein
VFADDVARAGGKISGKAKFASIRAAAFGSILAGSTSTTGQFQPKMDQSTGVISGATFDTTAGANFSQDLGVDDENGNPLTKVTAAPAAGQYSVSGTGVYTFNAAANTKTYTVNYVLKDSANGKTISYKNQLMGLATKYKLYLQTIYSAKPMTAILYAVVVPKISLALKNEDHTIQDLDFEAQDDGSGNVIDASVAD